MIAVSGEGASRGARSEGSRFAGQEARGHLREMFAQYGTEDLRVIIAELEQIIQSRPQDSCSSTAVERNRAVSA